MSLDEWELYRALHQGNAGDREFYRRVVSEAESVLELGCGWGRITEGLREGERRVVGLEPNDVFREAARELAGIEVVPGDMRDFDLGEQFSAILIPYNAIYCLGGRAGLLRCFQSVTRHLGSWGELWLDCYPIDDFHHALRLGETPPPDDDEPVLVLNREADEIRIFEETELMPNRQKLLVRYRALASDGSVLVTQHITHDYLLSHEILEAAEAVGLLPSLLAGGFDGRPLDDDPEQVVLGFVKQG